MSKNEVRQPLPPYIPFKTFQGFIQKLKDTAVPERVDSSLLKSYSGSIGRQLVAALKFLGLLDDNNFTTDKLKNLVKSFGLPEWSETFGDVAVEAYRDVIGDLNLDVATFGQLADRFKTRGADGQVLQKCITFYLAATRSVGWTISPHITSRERTRPERASRQRARRNAQTDEGETPPEAATTLSGSVRFGFPIPDKSTASIILPADLSSEDWQMIDTMIRAYIARKQNK